MKKNILIIVSQIDKSLEFEWTVHFIDRKKFNLSFLLLNPATSQLEDYLNKSNTPVYRINYGGKKDILPAFIKTILYIRRTRPHVVHTHLFDASLIGLLAAKFSRIKKRIHTRHNSSFHHQYFPHAVKYDKWINYLSTHIIAISNVVREVLIEKENVPSSKITLIYHGFNIAEFGQVSEHRTESLKQKYNPNNKSPVIGVISRYFHLKGIQYIIPAFKKILASHPDALLILANATGNYRTEIQGHLKDIPVQNKREISFEEDIAALYRLFDVFIHVPVNRHIEAFGQTYVEALAAGVPSIFTLSGVASEFIKDGQNAIVVPYESPENIYNAILKLLSDSPLRNKITEQGKKDVSQLFPIKKMIQGLEKLYE